LRGPEGITVQEIPLSRLFFGAYAPHLWQRRFYDFNVWSRMKRREKLSYMHENPVKRKLVQHPKDWPWSSWSFYAGREAGMVKIDPVD
jgi:hypothetical protein